MAFEHLMAYDGTSWQRIQIRTGADNIANTVQGLIANGFMYVYDGTAWDRLRGDSTDGMLVNLGSNNDVGTELAAAAALADGASNPTTPIVGAAKLGFNGTTWDRWRNNEEVTLLASAARTATANSSNQTNYNVRGMFIWFDVTAVPGTDTVQVRIQSINPVTSVIDVIHSFVAKDAAATYIYVVYPGNNTVPGGVEEILDSVIPRGWRLNVLHSGSGSFTYSVGMSYIV